MSDSYIQGKLEIGTKTTSQRSDSAKARSVKDKTEQNLKTVKQEIATFLGEAPANTGNDCLAALMKVQ
jgi:hypothetical protein